jgi:serine protease Do
MAGRLSRGRPFRAAGGIFVVLVLAACTTTDPEVATTPPSLTTTSLPAVTSAPTTSVSSEAPPTEPLDEKTVSLDLLVRATVQVIQVRDGVAVGWGSGTLVSPDGLILTNAHVATPTAPGLPTGLGEDPDQLLVALVEEEDRPPVLTYRAEVLTSEGYLDLAVLAIVATTEGSPIDREELALPFVELGDSDQIGLGEELIVLGFPGVGGDTISLTTGQVAGFLGDERVAVRAWVKTDSQISPGNSGGLAADQAGQIIGIPTEVVIGESFGELGRLRPVNLARTLIDDAGSGERYIRDSTVSPGGGAEQLTFSTWTTAVDAGGCALDSVEGFPTGATAMAAVFGWSGMTDGQEVSYQWMLDDRDVLFSDSFLWEGGPAGECAWFALDGGGAPLPEGAYGLSIFSSSDASPIGSASTTVGVDLLTTGVKVEGRIADLDTGRGIPGAVIYILRPGVDAEAWLFAERSFADVIASAQTDTAGRYLLSTPLGREVEYQVVVEATGYDPVWGEIRFDHDMPDSVELDDIWLVSR